MKKYLKPVFIWIILSIFVPWSNFAAGAHLAESISSPSAILIEASTGEIIFEKDAFSHRSPASVTKLMTMLLAAEAIARGDVSIDDTVTASAKAASMGGSQIWLEEGEKMSFGEMLKCVTVVSANDCCVAIAEHLAGSEEAFVEQMNKKAAELALGDTNFVCCSGLSDSDEHYSCAHDLAMIGRELLKYDFMKEYTTIWIDSIRGGEFTLSNTNKLIYRYKGATGLKTGFTSKAMHCLAASAERDGMEYIAVVLGASDSASRFEDAARLLDHAFANYTVVDINSLCALPNLPVKLGKQDCVALRLSDEGKILIEKNAASELETNIILPEYIKAPVSKAQELGKLELRSGEEIIAEIPICAAEEVERTGILDLFRKILASLMTDSAI